MARTLRYEEAQAFYDRFGSKQDLQGWYEDAATADLLSHGDMAAAQRVCEFGCGTGRLAARLLAQHLSPEAHYLGVDLSDTMVRLARARLARFGERAAVTKAAGPPRLPVPDHSQDRVLSTYVIDLLADEDIRALLGEAQRVLAPGGRLCLTSLTFGETPLSQLVTAAWRGLHALRPALVGGCRPVRLLPFLAEGRWGISHHAAITRFGLSSEVVIGSPPEPSAER